MIALIWAMDENKLIGNNNKLPWHVKEDLLYFKKMTTGKTVLMGHMTYLSMKEYYKTKSLPFGKIYVANLNNFVYSDAILVEDVIGFLGKNNEDIFVIGGKMIYSLSLPFADYLYISIIHGRYDGNVYFPNFDFTKFKLFEKDITEKVTFESYKKVK